MYQRIGFIGTGNMGSALAKAADRGAGDGAVLLLSNRTPSKAEALAQKLERGEASTNEKIAESCDIIFLGVKPQLLEGLLSTLRPILQKRKDRFVVCSMAAGVTLDRLEKMLGGPLPLVRILPNTPASIGKGVAQVCFRGVNEEEKEGFLQLLAPSGLLEEMDEELMTAANCVSGCGPAFAAMFLEALADGGVACGLPRDMAMRAAAQMMIGTGSLYLEEGAHPGAMKDAVCSPGGVTIQGVRVMEEQGFRSAAADAVIAAFNRTKTLGK